MADAARPGPPWALAGWATRALRRLDRDNVRERVVDANDGIIATAAIVEAFGGAGARDSTVLLAALASMVAGGLSLAGATYADEAVKRDIALAAIEEERRQLALAPEDALVELTDYYERKGLSRDLAVAVARELSAHDPLAAQVEADHGLSLADRLPTPFRTGCASGASFATGSAVPALLVLVLPPDVQDVVTVIAVVLALTVTSLVLARSTGTPLRRTLARSLLIGLFALGLTWSGGALFAAT